MALRSSMSSIHLAIMRQRWRKREIGTERREKDTHIDKERESYGLQLEAQAGTLEIGLEISI